MDLGIPALRIKNDLGVEFLGPEGNSQAPGFDRGPWTEAGGPFPRRHCPHPGSGTCFCPGARKRWTDEKVILRGFRLLGCPAFSRPSAGLGQLLLLKLTLLFLQTPLTYIPNFCDLVTRG